MSQPLITKSLYLKGRQCSKRLWFATRGIPEPETEDEDVWEERAREGAEVESLAERLFPNGIRICEPLEEDEPILSWSERVEATHRALEGDSPIFQAHLVTQELVAVTDILEPRAGGWYLWEVKASTYPTDRWTHVHDWDLAFQVHVARLAGIPIVGCGLLMLNKQFVRGPEEIDPADLIVQVDRSEVVEDLGSKVTSELDSMLTTVGTATEPRRWPAPRCKGSRRAVAGDRASSCGNLLPEGKCGAALPEYWAGTLSRLGGSKAKYVADTPGLSIESLDADDAKLKWTPNQQRAIVAVQADAPQIDAAALSAELDKLEWPIAYLDFEFDPGMAIPLFEGSRPYDRVPFQWAMVVQDSPGASLSKPQGFLHLDRSDPRREFAESLLAALPESGSIIAHHKSAETSTLQQLAERLGGEVAQRLRDACKRFQDTEVIANAGYYHPDQHGSYSIKKLAPVLIGRGYEELEIGNGMAAVMAWRRAIAVDASEEDRERVREQLVEYCGLDAELMHGILEELRRLAG